MVCACHPQESLYYHEGVPEVSGGIRPGPEQQTMLLELASTGAPWVTDELEPRSSERVLLSSLSIRVLVPLKASESVLGALVLGPKQSGETYSRPVHWTSSRFSRPKHQVPG